MPRSTEGLTTMRPVVRGNRRVGKFFRGRAKERGSLHGLPCSLHMRRVGGRIRRGGRGAADMRLWSSGPRPIARRDARGCRPAANDAEPGTGDRTPACRGFAAWNESLRRLRHGHGPDDRNRRGMRACLDAPLGRPRLDLGSRTHRHRAPFAHRVVGARERRQQVFGRDKVYRLPLPVCSACQARVRGDKAIKQFLRGIPEYRQLLDKFPDASVGIDRRGGA